MTAPPVDSADPGSEAKPTVLTDKGEDRVVLESGETALIIGEGSIARYLVTEQLARLKLPNDAIGETEKIEGIIVLDSSGVVDRQRSEIIVDLSTLVSDEPRRDRYLARNVLESRKFPLAKLGVEELLGLTWPLPTNGSSNLKLSGLATIHGETEPLIWSVRTEFFDGIVTGLAQTEFRFGKFGMSIPSLAFIVSVEDKVRLQVEFTLEVTTAP